jgi:formylglycine-generating enzyme required for sulfatase activity
MRQISAIVLAACLCLAVFTASADGNKFAPGTTFKDCEGCPEMVVIPPGSFTMGSPSDEARRRKDEGPQHRVNIRYKLAVGKFEVTQAEWRHVMGNNPSHFKGERNPVERVSWKDTQAYLRKLSHMTGKHYGLLSEVEWEYVARAGTTTPFYTGSTITSRQANFDGNYTYDGASEGQNRRQTIPAGQFSANRFGVYDMHGNVWEIVGDCWNGSYSGAPDDGSGWAVGYCYSQVLRGGSWNNRPTALRSANRRKAPLAISDNSIGFRVARTLSR